MRWILLFLLVPITTSAHVGYLEQIALIEKRLAETPDNLPLQIRRAYLLRMVNRLQDSHDALTNLLQKHPTNSTIYYQRALTYKEMNQYPKAEQDLTKALHLNKTGSLYAERALIREKQKKYKLALIDYHYSSRYPQDENFYLRYAHLHSHLQDPKNAQKILHLGLQQWPHSIALTKQLAHLYTQQNNSSQAHQLIDPMLAKRSFKTPWLLIKAEIYAAKQLPQAQTLRHQALTECNQKIQTGKASAIHYTYKAEALLALGKPQQAQTLLQQIIQQHPKYFRAQALQKQIEKSQKEREKIQK